MSGKPVLTAILELLYILLLYKIIPTFHLQLFISKTLIIDVKTPIQEVFSDDTDSSSLRPGSRE